MKCLVSVLVAFFVGGSAFAGDATAAVASDAERGDSTAAKIALTGSDGRMHTPLAENGQAATVLVFLMHDCPVTNAMAPELARLSTEFAPRGVRFFGVYVTESKAEIATHL